MKHSDFEYWLLNSYRNNDSWCWCNQPEEGLKLIRDILNLCPLYENENWKKVKKLLGSDGAFQLIIGDLNNRDLLEHGGGMVGSWLTDLGKEIREYLNSINLDKDYLDTYILDKKDIE